MNQSKMASIREKEFVIKHSFENLMDLEHTREVKGEKEAHFNIPWRIWIYRDDDCLFFGLGSGITYCSSDYDQLVDATVIGKLTKKDGIDWFTRDMEYPDDGHNGNLDYPIGRKHLEDYMVDGKLAVEYHVKINKTIGIETGELSEKQHKILRSFDDNSAKELSDITLIVGDQKFHVNKMYLATHCTYFKSMFLGNFQESEKSEVEMKNIDSFEMQKFLELIYGEPAVDEDTVKGILKLADKFDAKTALRQCEKFLVYESKEPLKEKFALAIQYKMENLKTKCISELETVDDLRSIVPENSDQFDTKLWKELFMKLLSHST